MELVMLYEIKLLIKTFNEGFNILIVLNLLK
uniref:Uncharacterized protein n=1 Tax=CrAss-like virus sp. ctYsL76 TaxID=2826826 RepID=A0A8S5QMI0_9CAUD|nr:MAG TPA: hypothetical protein [CrAss-like virus sp. ctYsL76]